MVSDRGGSRRRIRDIAGSVLATFLALGLLPEPACAEVRTPEGFGAVGDGKADDQAALVRALASVRPGDTLRLGPGRRYAHSGKLALQVADARVEGHGSTLIATDPGAATFLVGDSADRATVRNLRFEVLGAKRRNNANFDSCPLVVGRNAGFEGENLVSSGSSGCGLFVFGARGFVLANVSVDRSWADGLHITHGASDGLVVNPTILRAGDDGVAVVSYENDPAPCERITVVRPHVRFGHARGVSVVGGTDVAYLDVDVADTRAAGVMIAAERGDFSTKQAVRCRVRGGRIARPDVPVAADEVGRPDPPLDHGAVLLYNARADAMIDCEVSDVEVVSVGPGSPFDVARAIVENGGTFDRCALLRVTVGPAVPRAATLIGGNHQGQVAGADTWADLRPR